MELTPSAHVDTFARDHLPPASQWPDLIFTLPELRYPPRLNCAEQLLDTTIARRGADRPCLRGETETWTYGDLARRSRQVAQVLVEDHGLLPGNRVMLRGPNGPWLVACWLGVLMAGGVVVTVLPMHRPGELAAIGEAARVQLALCDARFVDDLVKADVSRLRVVEYGGTSRDDLVVACARKPGAFRPVATAADDVSLIAFTSGTTGRPKGCVHFHRDVLAIADTFGRHVLKLRPDDLVTGSPPLAFTFGLGGLVVFPLRAGAATLLLESGAPAQLLDAIERHRASVVFTAPTAYRAMLPALPGRGMALRRCVSAGETLPAATWQAWHDATGIKIIDGIGSTEMLHIFIGSADDDIRPGSTGRPVPGFEAKIIDGNGGPVPDGQPGRLAVRGPVGCRYLADERQTTYVRDGWNLTGDTFVRDGEGYFWYQARSDDMIVSSGYNIAGPEVEQALLRCPDVLDAAVIGAPDPDRGQIVSAFVVPRQGVARDEVTVRRLQDFVKHEIAPFKYPRVVRFVDVLPRTATGKLQRFRLRELL